MTLAVSTLLLVALACLVYGIWSHARERRQRLDYVAEIRRRAEAKGIDTSDWDD
jgi:hypothetical protein